MTKNIIKDIYGLFLPYRIGFARGHYYLNDDQLAGIEQALEGGEEKVVAEYDKKFSGLIGGGSGTSFAAGRMAFYSLLEILGVGEGDEVILTGFTCSVMVNAVWRSGAVPVFTDIDEDTMGTSADGVEKKITPCTKVIVAQHSFGIPCDIRKIAQIAKKHGIFLVEDSALSVDSAVGGITVGNWGDAAIFSTDHSKPLNTLAGGFLYTKDNTFYEKIKSYSSRLPHLDIGHQRRLYSQLLFERKNYVPSSYPRAKLVNKFRAASNIFFDADYRKEISESGYYTYPSRLSPFLAKVGIFELERWQEEKMRRKRLLNGYINIAENAGLSLPGAYHDKDLDITPLRFVFQHPDAAGLLKKMDRFIDVNWTWFREPIVCAPDGVESLGYKPGDCPVSERVGGKIINWPCVISNGWETILQKIFKNIIR